MNIEKINGFWVPSNDIHIKNWKDKDGVYARFTQDKCFEMFLRYCRNQKEKFRTVLDIGAWCGTWSYEIQKYAERVIAFEPDKVHAECYKKNLKQFPTCEVITKAVGNEKGSVTLTDDNFTQGKRVESITGNVPIVTIDSFNYENVDLIKIDVEGYEMNVLQGAKNTLKETKYLMVELNNNTKKYGSNNREVEKYIRELGFRLLLDRWPDKVFVKK